MPQAVHFNRKRTKVSEESHPSAHHLRPLTSSQGQAGWVTGASREKREGGGRVSDRDKGGGSKRDAREGERWVGVLR